MKSILCCLLSLFLLISLVTDKAMAFSNYENITPYYVNATHVATSLNFANGKAHCKCWVDNTGNYKTDIDMMLLFSVNNQSWNCIDSWHDAIITEEASIVHTSNITQKGYYKVNVYVNVYKTDGTHIESETQEYTSYYQGSGCYN